VGGGGDTGAGAKGLDVVLAQGGVSPRLQTRHSSLRLLGAQQLTVHKKGYNNYFVFLFIIILYFFLL
jgi:hypothetical protein